ncbi:MAG: FG-GAP repeat protein, partial [Anaerolineales bacterium]
ATLRGKSMNIKKRAGLIILLPLFSTILMTGSGLYPSLARSAPRPQMQESGPGWVLLSAPDTQPEDNFGYSAAIDGDFLVAGAPGMALPSEGDAAAAESVSGNRLAGAVYVFERQGDNWTEGTKLMASDAQAGDQFGLRVALSADTLAIGAPYKWVSSGGNAAGAVYVYQHQGDAWTQQARLTAPDGAPFDLFGSALALRGDTLAVGARSADSRSGRNAGAVYVYQRQGGDWSLQATLAAEDAAGSDFFGHDLVLMEEALLVGAPGHDERASDDNFGAVYLFRRRGDAWNQAAKLSAPDLAANAQFGAALWRYQARLTPEQRLYLPLYFLRAGRVAAGGRASSGEFIVLSMGFYGSYVFQRQGEQWIELSAPEILYQAMGVHTMSQLLGVDQDTLIFGSMGLSEAGSGVLLVEMK